MAERLSISCPRGTEIITDFGSIRQNPNRIGNANDGGASISTDGGKTWTTQNNQPTAQFYHVAVDNAFPYHIYGAQQDNSNVGIASRTDSGVIGREDWFVAGGGECGFVVPDPRDWHIIYSNSEGYITRYDKNKEEVQDVSRLVRSITPDMALPILPIAFNGSRRSCFRRTTRTCSTPRPNAFSNRPITAKAGRKSAAISRATTNQSSSQAAVR